MQAPRRAALERAGTMGTVDFHSTKGFDRRIGKRLELDGIDVINVTWLVPQTGRFGRRKPPLELPGRIENVSITGAAIVGPRELGLSPGDEAVIRCGGRDNIVSIRHCEPTADERTLRHGVEITSVQPNLKARLQELLDPTLARMPVESAGPGRLSLNGGLVRPTRPSSAGEVVLDLTDATMAEVGAAVLDMTESAPTAPAVETPSPDQAEPEPEPEPESAEVGAPPQAEAPAETEAETPIPTLDPHVPVAHPAHLPPIEMSEGRRVLDEVFGLMED